MNRLPTVRCAILIALLLFSLALSSCQSVVSPGAPHPTPQVSPSALQAPGPTAQTPSPTPQVSRLTPRASRIATDDSTSLTVAPDWSVTSDQGGVLLGYSVASAGDVNGDGYDDVIVGAPRYELGETEEGAAFLYLGGPGGPATSPVWIGESDQEYAWFGWAVASAGDVNDDGYADVIVGAPRYDVVGTVTLTDAGQAYLYYGGPTGIVTSTVWITHTDQAHARFGAFVSTAGDVNGDGYGDVIITANGYDAEETNEGAAFVYHGGPAGLAATPAWTDHPTDQAYANFGRSASMAGDVNGDGYGDVVVSASWYDTGATDEDRDRGAVFAYQGGPDGLADAPSWTATGDRREAEFGIAVASAGDVNGDDYGDLVVGAYKYTEDYEHPWREGAVFAYLGGAAGLGGSPAWSVRSGQESAKFGSVVSSGDLNGDDYVDIVVGAYSYDGGQPYEGAFFVYHGETGGLAETYDWSDEGDQEGAGLGFAVCAAGDVNGDGYSDVIVGAPTYNSGIVDAGVAFVYLGSD